ncbi:hypothetical protein GCM10010385_63300 [Streptomyces geysiriensis]|nr:hypothetical protein GCM10010385_63300 [Streptomyces geysiriensis]
MLSYMGGHGCKEGLADHSGGNLARTLGMTSSPVGRDRSDRPFAEIGDLALLLRHLETGAALSLIEHHLGRQDLGLERLNDQALCVLMAPADDWKDEQDHEEGHIAVVGRVDWTGAEAKSLTGRDLAGPRVPGPRPDHREGARQAVARVPAMRTRRHHIIRALG